MDLNLFGIDTREIEPYNKFIVFAGRLNPRHPAAHRTFRPPEDPTKQFIDVTVPAGQFRSRIPSHQFTKHSLVPPFVVSSSVLKFNSSEMPVKVGSQVQKLGSPAANDLSKSRLVSLALNILRTWPPGHSILISERLRASETMRWLRQIVSYRCTAGIGQLYHGLRPRYGRTVPAPPCRILCAVRCKSRVPQRDSPHRATL